MFERGGWDVYFDVRAASITARVAILEPLPACTCRCDHDQCPPAGKCHSGKGWADEPPGWSIFKVAWAVCRVGQRRVGLVLVAGVGDGPAGQRIVEDLPGGLDEMIISWTRAAPTAAGSA
jgi:hypothetical protein